MGAFGEKLRKQREQRGLALDAISNTTKISTRMLRALEEEHFDQLPGGVFNKGFVRAYARQVGLDEEQTITDYLAALRESQVQSQKILPDFRNPASTTPPVRPTDSRHHILPASDHPTGDGKGKSVHDVSTAERRRNEDRRNVDRRNEDRRNQDREPPHQLPGFAALRNLRPNKGGRDHDSQERDRNSDRAEGVRELDTFHQDSQPAARIENESRSHDTASMPGFITLGPTTENSTESTDAPAFRLSLGRKLGAAALLLLIVGLAALLYHRHQESPANSAVTSTSSTSAPAVQASPPVASSIAASSITAPSPKIAHPSSATKPSIGNSSATLPPPTSTQTSATANTPKPPVPSSGADGLVSESATSPTAKPAATFSLTIRAEETTWVSITADGKPIAHETLIAPAHTSVRATREIAVRVGNAAGVSFLLNGKEFPAQGNSGEVKIYVFDATGLKLAQTPSSTSNQ